MLEYPKINPAFLGQRLIDARKACGITQSVAAKHLECSRPTLIAIEKGTRSAKPNEILLLARLYGSSVHNLLRTSEPASDMQPHLRAVAERIGNSDKELDNAIAALQRFAENYGELEQMMQLPLAYNYPRSVQLQKNLNIEGLAEDTAISERRRLGLGDQPVHKLRAILESDVGLRIKYDDLPSAVAGMYAYAGDLGCCVLINLKHPPERRRATLAHEYGHVIVDRYKPGIDYLTHKGRKPANERFAEIFGMALLMPSSSVRRHFNNVVIQSGDFQVADLCRLSHFFFVSVEAMAYRLEKIDLIPTGTVDHLRESKFHVMKAKQVLELPSLPATRDKYPNRYVVLAVQAFEETKISQMELANLLECDLVSARLTVDIVTQSLSVDENGEIGEYRFDFHRSLLSEP